MDDFARRVAGEDLSLDPAIPLRRVAEDQHREVDLAGGLCGRLAYLLHEQARELLTVLGQEICHRTEVRATDHRGRERPGRLRVPCRPERALDVAVGRARKLGERRLGRGIDDVERRARRGAPARRRCTATREWCE